MAHKKAGGSTRLGRDSNAQRLGVKLHDGQLTKAGMVIVRQRGSKVFPGLNVKRGRDDTLYAARAGQIKFTERKRLRFDGQLRPVKLVSVVAAA